ncbi:MAG: sulfite exporter TauE/SafE family protein [Synechococcales bacterium]|nr:sulfite exporter TauE/SafE family protein [Synechococcales bacterium]
MEYWEWALEIGLVAIAGYVRGFSGFGSAMILTPGLSLVFNPQQAVAIVILLEMVASIGLIPEALPKTKWPEVLPMAIAAVLVVPLGALCLSLIDPNLMRDIIGGSILGFVVLLLTGQHYQGQPHITVNFVVGALSGFLMGLIGMGGPPIVLYQLSGEDTAVENRANFISFFALTQIVALASYWLNDLLTVFVLQRFLIFLPVSLLGLFLGRSSFKHVSESLFRKCVLAMLVAIALLALLL